MRNRNTLINAIYVFIGVLIVLIISDLTKEYIYIMNHPYEIKYVFYFMLLLCLSYGIFGLWLGIKDIYRQYRSDGRWKFSNVSFILVFIISLVILTSFCIHIKYTILNSLILVLFTLSGYIISQSIKRI